MEMGLDISTLKQLLSVQSISEPCLPFTPYLTLSKDLWPCDKNGLVADFHALPEKLRPNLPMPDLYWWCDAKFIPFKDTSLFTSCSVYFPRNGRRWGLVPHVPSGKVISYDLLSPENIRCKIYGRTNSTVFPNLSPHPIGELVAYCGTGEAVIMSQHGDPVYSRSRDLTNAVHVYCTIASNGISFACLKRGMGVFFLEHHHLDTSLTTQDVIRCHHICKDFIPSNVGNDTAVCKFSPNSKQIAVSMETGLLFIVMRVKLEKHCIICPDMLDDRLSSSEAFDYDPRYASEILSLSTIKNIFYTINVNTAQVLFSLQMPETVDCLVYSHDGCLIAVGFHSFNISVYTSADLTCIHQMLMSDLCLQNVQVQRDYPSVLHLSFSQNGQHLVSTTSDGHIRLWRIPKLLTLQQLCRDRILASMPVFRVKQLNNIPNKLKKFIIYKFF